MVTVNKPQTKSPLDRRTKSEKGVFVFVFVLFSIYTLIMFLPLLWLLMSSFKEHSEYALDVMNRDVFALPDKLYIQNYFNVFKALKYNETNFLGMIFNSIWYIAFSVFPQLFCNSLFGYIMAKYNFKGKEILLAICIFTITVPIVGTGAAYYVLVNSLKIYNTPLYPLITNIYFFGANFLFFRATYSSISWSYAEAVFMDGGSHWTAYFKIMMPQALPVYSTLLITTCIGLWNDYMPILLYLPDYPTVASGLYKASLTVNRSGGMVLYYTGLVVSMIPVLAIFIIFSDKLMKNLSIGGLKG